MNNSFPLRSGIALGLLSASVIIFQLSLMQVLAFVQWHHFAYMVISVAMLGFGAAGTMIALFRVFLFKHKETLLPLFSVASGLSLELAVRLTNLEFFSYDLYLLFIDRSQVWMLAANMLLYFLPFFFAALVIGLFFTFWITDIGRLYFANLIGSGIGGLLSLVLLNAMFPGDALSFSAFLAMISGLLMIRNLRPPLALSLILTVATGFLLIWLWPVQLNPSQYKGISKTLNLPQAEIVYQEPGIYGVNQVVTSPHFRYAPGVSLVFRDEIPVKPALFSNGDFIGPLPDKWKTKNHPGNFSTFALPFRLTAPDTVLVINGGTGSMAAQAMREGALHVDMTEPNRRLIRQMETVLATLSDSIFLCPGIKVHATEARTFMASTTHKYNLIVLPVLQSFGGSSGLYAMQENYTMTIEGFHQIWRLLKPDGFFTVSSWLDYPVRTPLKIASTIVEMLHNQGINDAAMHIALVKSWGNVTFVVGKQPINTDHVGLIRTFCQDMNFDPVLLPDITPEERNHFHYYSDPGLFEMLDEIIAGQSSQLFEDYAFHVSPATDDRPYFNQFVRLRSIPELSALYNQQSLPFLELGYIILFVTLIQVILLALALIIIPLFRLRVPVKNRRPVLVYFASLGLGYMFFEIILIQRFILYFGNPVIAASVVISIMMIASGAGSYVAGNLSNVKIKLKRVLWCIIAIGAVYVFSLTHLLSATVGSGIIVKSIIAFGLIALPAFFMGMPFPTGLKALSRQNEKLVPWAWGINGCLSVIASPLAIMIAVEAGFTMVMLTAVIAYLLALLKVGELFKRSPVSFPLNSNIEHGMA